MTDHLAEAQRIAADLPTDPVLRQAALDTVSALATLAVAESVERLLMARTDEPSLVRLDRVEAARKAVRSAVREALYEYDSADDVADFLYSYGFRLDRAEGR